MMVFQLFSTLLEWRKPSVERAAEESTPIVIRPIRPDDEPRLVAFFNGLSPRSRHRRFHGVVNELPPEIVSRFVHPDGRDELALVAVVKRGGREMVIAEARYALSGSATRSAEFAIVVADSSQGHGLGTRLLRSLMRRAAENQISKLYGDVLPDNGAMLRLAGAFGFRQRRDPDDPRLLRVEKTVLAGSATTMTH